MQQPSHRRPAGESDAGGVAAARSDSGDNRLTFRLPDGTVDCHMHIYDDRYPAAAGTVLRPPNASVAQYRALQERLGFCRSVVVHPSTYGTDNRCTLDALKRLGPHARGVAVVGTSVTDTELATLHAAGVRGIRFNLSLPGATTIEMLAPLAARIADFGWHVKLVAKGAVLPSLEKYLERLPCPLVIDHIAHIPQPDGVKSDAMRTAQRLVERGNTWLTLSGPYIDTRSGGPAYPDVAPVAKAFVALAPERMLWGSDWPHPTQKCAKPDDVSLIEHIASWIGRADRQRMIFADNAAELYDFPPLDEGRIRLASLRNSMK